LDDHGLNRKFLSQFFSPLIILMQSFDRPEMSRTHYNRLEALSSKFLGKPRSESECNFFPVPSQGCSRVGLRAPLRHNPGAIGLKKQMFGVGEQIPHADQGD
jgi:hypothetical protein